MVILKSIFINKKIPPSPHVKLIDILIYLLVLTNGLVVIDSIIVFRQSDPNYLFDWRTDGWFIATIIINMIVVFIILVMFILHKVFWERIYTKPINIGKK